MVILFKPWLQPCVCLYSSPSSTTEVCVCVEFMCMRKRMFSILSLLADVERQSQRAESHYGTSPLPPTRSDAVHLLSHTRLPRCARTRVCVHMCWRSPTEAQKKKISPLHACVPRAQSNDNRNLSNFL